MSRAAAKAVMQAVKTLIDGHITVGSTNVPLFFGKTEGEPELYIKYGISGENTDDDTFDMSVSNMTLFFQICEVRDSTAKSETIEDIEDAIRLKINPTKNTIGFSLSDPFHLPMCEFDNAGDIDIDEDGAKFKHSKTINFRIIVTQSN